MSKISIFRLQVSHSTILWHLQPRISAGQRARGPRAHASHLLALASSWAPAKDFCAENVAAILSDCCMTTGCSALHAARSPAVKIATAWISQQTRIPWKPYRVREVESF